MSEGSVHFGVTKILEFILLTNVIVIKNMLVFLLKKMLVFLVLMLQLKFQNLNIPPLQKVTEAIQVCLNPNMSFWDCKLFGFREFRATATDSSRIVYFHFISKSALVLVHLNFSIRYMYLSCFH